MLQPPAPSKQVTELAKKGHAESLDALLNYFMFRIGNTAKSSFKDNLIEVILEGTKVTPEPKQSEKYVQQLFNHLQIPEIIEVKIFAKDYYSQRLAWWRSIKFSPLNISKQSSLQTPKSSEVNLQSQSAETHKTNQSSSSSSPAHHFTNSLVADTLHVPQPVAFENLPINLQRNIKSAGLRSGETRSYLEAKQMYEMMPESVRRGGEDAIRNYKSSHDWSHKKAYANGGSSRPSNGDWEASNINRSRGSRQMTKAEANDIAQAKAKINFQEGSKIVASQAIQAGGLAFGLELAFSGLDNFLAVQRGEKTVEDALAETLVNSAEAAVVTTTVVGGVMALSLIFPPVGAVVAASAPALQIVGGASCIKRLVDILSKSGKVQGIDQIENLLLSYGIDEVELSFQDLEIEDELLNLKLSMQ